MTRFNVIALTNLCFFIIWAGLLLMVGLAHINVYWKIQYILISLFAFMYILFKWQKDALGEY